MALKEISLTTAPDSFFSRPLPPTTRISRITPITPISTTFHAFALLALAAPLTFAQTTAATLSLPDAPGFSPSLTMQDSSHSTDSVSNSPQDVDPTSVANPKRRRLLSTRKDVTIQPGETAPRLTQHDKVVLGLRQSFTLFSVAGWTASAGYNQLINGSPNYGTDSGAFGERLGATAIRSVSHNIMGNAVFAPLLHEDPRYYKMGTGHNPAKRALYAATRALITRSDDGRARPNYSLISGNLAAAALTNTYYPDMNRGFEESAKTFGNSMGGSAIGFVVTEFLDDALGAVHLKKLE